MALKKASSVPESKLRRRVINESSSTWLEKSQGRKKILIKPKGIRIIEQKSMGKEIEDMPKKKGDSNLGGQERGARNRWGTRDIFHK